MLFQDCGDKDLANPFSLNIVHSDGRLIQFAKYQLNTLDMSSSIRNYCWMSPIQEMYSKVYTQAAKPTVSDLNPESIKYLQALLTQS